MPVSSQTRVHDALLDVVGNMSMKVQVMSVRPSCEANDDGSINDNADGDASCSKKYFDWSKPVRVKVPAGLSPMLPATSCDAL